jgi:heterodisulfide reductase subunit B
MEYSYFPGCSLKETGIAYDISISEITPFFGIELTELSDWNCCGATCYISIDRATACAISARNLSLAERESGVLVTPCSACYTILKKTNRYIKKYPEVKEKVGSALNRAGLSYGESVEVLHILEVFVKDIGYSALSEKVKRDLSNLKIAPYYGCQLVRGDGFDHPEAPESLDRLIEALGAVPLKFSHKARCCGGTLNVTKEEAGLSLIKDVLKSAEGADLIITTCPLCQINLDLYQRRLGFSIPILYFTQLIGVALGLSAARMGLNKLFAKADLFFEWR